MNLIELFPYHERSNPSLAFDHCFKILNKQVGFWGKGKIMSVFCGKFMALPGALHAGLKLHNCCGMMFGNFVKNFMSSWRDTLAKVYWILFPKDPRQLKNELQQYIIEMYRSAFLWLWDPWGKDRERIPTATDVHRYTLERAKDCPYRQACLVELRYAEITKLLKNDSRVGKRGCAELFMTAVRLSLPLFATMHAVDYVRLGCDLMIFWKCASPALKKLYENEIFTGITSQGELLPRGKCMEWSVKHTRKYTGKVERKGMKKLLEKTVSRIPEEKSDNLMREELRSKASISSGTKPRTRDWLTTESPVMCLHDLIHNKIQLWHHTNQPIIGDYDKETPKFAEPNSFLLPEKETLFPDVLLVFDTGLTRVIRYMQVYYIDTPFRVDRSEKEVALNKLLASSVDRAKELKRTIGREVSLVTSGLDDAMTTPVVGTKLLQVVDDLNKTLGELENPYVVKLGQMSKRDRIKKLIELRRIYFQSDPSSQSLLERSAREEIEKKYPSKVRDAISGDVLPKKEIYCLSESVLSLDRYKSQSSS